MNLNNSSSKTLWIGEIDSWMDEKFLVKVFSEYGKIQLNQQSEKVFMLEMMEIANKCITDDALVFSVSLVFLVTNKAVR